VVTIGGREGGGCGIFALSRDLALDVFEGVPAIGVEVWMTEGPRLRDTVRIGVIEAREERDIHARQTGYRRYS